MPESTHTFSPERGTPRGARVVLVATAKAKARAKVRTKERAKFARVRTKENPNLKARTMQKPTRMVSPSAEDPSPPANKQRCVIGSKRVNAEMETIANVGTQVCVRCSSQIVVR